MSFSRFESSVTTVGFYLDNYEKILTDGITLKIFFQTVELSLMITLFCLLLGYPVAMLMRRVGPKARLWILLLVVSPLLTSIIVRNVASGSITQRLGIEDGTVLKEPLLEYCLKDDALGDPIIAREHILTFGWASAPEFDQIVAETHKINHLLTEMFAAIDLRLIDFKLEFGRTHDGTLMLADEISPDNCRLWQVGTDEKMDKDRFRRDLGGLTEAYSEIARRLGLSLPAL